MLYLLVSGFVLLLLLLYLPLRIKFTYHRCDGSSKTVFWLGVLGGNFRLSSGKLYPTEDGDWPGDGREKTLDLGAFLHSWGKWKGYIKVVLPSLRRLFSRSKIDVHQLRLEIGTGDAAETGIMVGFLWGGIGLFSPILFHRNKFAPQIIPAYNRQVFNMEFCGILEVRPVHIISGVLGLLVSILWGKYTSKGEGVCGGTSNPRFNANCHGKY